MQDSLDIWFKREILGHEAALLRYLTRVWRKHDEVRDLRQEIYARVYEAAQVERPASPKAFLFATARNMITDRIRRSRVVSIEAVGDSELFDVLVDDLGPERRASNWEDLRRVARALNRLPPRCREVIWLRKVDELSTREVAQRLRLSERTVEGQILKGMRLLTDAVFGGASGGGPLRRDVDGTTEAEAEHGGQ